jgi:hypothetical protein
MPIDRDDLLDLVHRYSDAVTRKDRGAWSACWSEDATWDLGKGRLSRGKRDIVDFWQTSVDQLVVVVQLVHNGSLVVDDAQASGRWYISEHLQRSNGVRGLLLAWYDDTYVRVGDQWLFASRSLAPLYHGPPDLAGDFTPQP